MVFTSSWSSSASRRHFHLLHVPCRPIGRWCIFRDATPSRIISGRNAEPGTFFFSSAVSSAPFLCCFEGNVAPRIPMHRFHLVRGIVLYLISRGCGFAQQTLSHCAFIIHTNAACISFASCNRRSLVQVEMLTSCDFIVSRRRDELCTLDSAIKHVQKMPGGVFEDNKPMLEDLIFS